MLSKILTVSLNLINFEEQLFLFPIHPFHLFFPLFSHPVIVLADEIVSATPGCFY